MADAETPRITEEPIPFLPSELRPVAAEALIMVGGAVATRNMGVVVEAADVDGPGVQLDENGISRLSVAAVDPVLGITTTFDLKSKKGERYSTTTCTLTTVGDALGEDVTVEQSMYLERSTDGGVRRLTRATTYVRELGEGEPRILRGASREAGPDTILGMLHTAIQRAPERVPDPAAAILPARGGLRSDKGFMTDPAPIVDILGRLLALTGEGMRDTIKGRYLAAALAVNFSTYGVLHGPTSERRQAVLIGAGVETKTALTEPQAEFSLVIHSAGRIVATVCRLETLQPDGMLMRQQAAQDGDRLQLIRTEGMIAQPPESRHEIDMVAGDIEAMARHAVAYATGRQPVPKDT